MPWIQSVHIIMVAASDRLSGLNDLWECVEGHGRIRTARSPQQMEMPLIKVQCRQAYFQDLDCMYDLD